MPYMVRIFGKADAHGFLFGFRRIEQAQFHPGRMLGKKRKVDALTVPCGAEGIRMPWPLCCLVRSVIHGPIPGFGLDEELSQRDTFAHHRRSVASLVLHMSAPLGT